MNTDKNLLLLVVVNSINRTSIHASPTLDAQLFLHHNPSTFSLAVGLGWTDLSTWSRFAGHTYIGNKTSRKAA